jgi:TolA-binding protein
MSSLITKTTKRRSSAPQKIRTAKAQKASSRKPARPGRITAAPKTKRAAPKKTAGKKTSQRPAAKKSSGSTRKPAAQKHARPSKQVKAARKAIQSKKVATVKPSGPSKPKVVPRKVLAARRRLPVPKPVPPPPKKPPSPGTLAAVRAFEQALRLFNRHDFAAAKPAFESLLSKFAEESEILARVRTYLAICDQRLARAPAAPRSPDALYDQGVVEFNKGNTTEAIQLFEKALKADPRADHVHYSLAAAYARLGNAPKALEALRRAIVLRPMHRSHARRDLDFVGLRSNEDFQHLTGFGFDLIEE